MPEQSLISIILPVFNGENYLAEAVESVVRQSITNWELIIIDDGSTDSSAIIIEQFQCQHGAIQCISQRNTGVTEARNRGIEAARGEYIAFLDQDDYWAPETLAFHLNYHQLYPDVRYTLANQVCFLDDPTQIPGWFKLQKLDVPHAGHLPGTLFVKRDLFQEIGKFDPQYPISSDADWFARCRDAGIYHATIPETVLYRRIHGGNQSRQAKVIQRELMSLLSASIKRKRVNNG